jgi:hypothetical protein
MQSLSDITRIYLDEGEYDQELEAIREAENQAKRDLRMARKWLDKFSIKHNKQTSQQFNNYLMK